MSGMNTHATGLNGAVAAVIRGRLREEGWTQADLAQASGIPLVSVQRYLKPTRAIDVAVLDRFAQALRTDAQSLMVAAAERLSRLA